MFWTQKYYDKTSKISLCASLILLFDSGILEKRYVSQTGVSLFCVYCPVTA